MAKIKKPKAVKKASSRLTEKFLPQWKKNTAFKCQPGIQKPRMLPVPFVYVANVLAERTNWTTTRLEKESVQVKSFFLIYHGEATTFCLTTRDNTRTNGRSITAYHPKTRTNTSC